MSAELSKPIAYLYHDAPSAELANPLFHSVLLTMAESRMPHYRNETPLVTLVQAEAMVTAERERLTKALRKHVLTYQVDDQEWDREAAADRAVARLLNNQASG